MMTAGVGMTKPDAGVIATRPATAPEAMPSTLGFPLTAHSMNIQARAAAAVALCVTATALPARPSGGTPPTPLHPHPPTPNGEAPPNRHTPIWGATETLFYFTPLPRGSAQTSAA